MRLVADANVLFSCLIRDGATRRLYTHPGLTLFAHSFIVEKFFKYEDELLRKSGTKPNEFKLLFSDVLSILTIIPETHLDAYMPAAATLSNDKKDWPYLALRLEGKRRHLEQRRRIQTTKPSKDEHHRRIDSKSRNALKKPQARKQIRRKTIGRN